LQRALCERAPACGYRAEDAPVQPRQRRGHDAGPVAHRRHQHEGRMERHDCSGRGCHDPRHAAGESEPVCEGDLEAEAGARDGPAGGGCAVLAATTSIQIFDGRCTESGNFEVAETLTRVCGIIFEGVIVGPLDG